ncbi:potassium transporter Kup [Roseisolibacter sp. H3M3-2]|uniref:potassium transporter Kup n=1 Tax=Roseisolibacter sp. H3M3-2 TaxID=3031323 RepID=UPI0023DA3307|nr:potassium transporter Kup [Roseisolibacter sp. H3M3-2]MDF1503792.1 potassium transporter Kup [Roseisolibacter sp. H3M3-2]
MSPDPGAQPAPTATTELPAVPHGGHGQHHRPEANPTGRKLAVLTLTALGVVYGDIGTSPLYSIKECFGPEFGLTPTVSNVYGVLSLIVWSLALVVSVKYVLFILRADNKGEGGVYALLALLLQRQNRNPEKKRRALLVALGLFGGAFLYGDGIITPAISVLGAVEGLGVITPTLSRFVIPIAFVIIAALFALQSKGTAKVGGAFGWIMLAWFVSIALLGIAEVVRHPEIVKALNPWYAVRFYVEHPARSFVVLGAVVLVITGGEALYADMGHFGRKPIRLAWFAFVLPCLLLNYFGQGALLLRMPEAIANPFYLLAPESLRVPLLVIATLAAIVASQALISGAFSLTQQAILLGYVPRLQIVHTSSEQAGQIYIPEVNKALAVGTLVLVVTFRSAAALAATYGVAVTATMAITTILFSLIARQRFGWSRWQTRLFLYGFLTIDLVFFAANLLKVPHGGWVPLAVAALVFLLMTTWKRGRAILQELLQRGTVPMDMFLADVARKQPPRVPGTAVFMTSTNDGAPVVLLHHLKHNKVLHERVILLSVRAAEVPDVDEEETLEVEELGHGFYRVVATYGFMETPDVPQVMKFLHSRGIRARTAETSYYLGRERLIPSGKMAMARWRKKLFVFMSRNARSATEFFNIPPNRVVELGTQIEF